MSASSGSSQRRLTGESPVQAPFLFPWKKPGRWGGYETRRSPADARAGQPSSRSDGGAGAAAVAVPL